MHLYSRTRDFVRISFSLLLVALFAGLAQPAQAAPQVNVKLNHQLEANKPVLDFRVSPDGARIAYRVARTLPPAQDAPPPPAADLYSVPASGGTAVRLNPAATTADESVQSYQFSADGSEILYLRTISDTTAGNVFELFRVPADGSGAPASISGPIPVGNRATRDFSFNFEQGSILTEFGDGSVRTVNFTVHHSAVPERITQIQDGTSNTIFFGEQVNNLLQRPEDGSVRQLNPDLVSGGVVYDFQMTPDGTRAIYRADQNLDGTIELFSVPADGSNAGFRISGPMVAGGDVVSFKVNATSSRAVYLADQDSNGVVELYSARTNGGIVTKLNGPLVSGGNVTQFQISPDGNLVVYLADQNTDGAFQLFGVLTTGSTPGLFSSQLALPSIRSFLISPDGSRIFYVDTSGPDGSLRLFIRTATMAFATITAGGGPPVANIPAPDLQVSADGNRLVYLADAGNDGLYELASITFAPTKVVVSQLNAPLVAGGNIRAFKLSPDGQRVLYVADQNTPGVFELFSVPTGGGTVDRVSGPMVSGGSARFGPLDFQFSPDSRSVFYLASQQTATLTELFTAFDAPVVDFAQSGYVVAEDGTLTNLLALQRSGKLLAPSRVRVQLTGSPEGGTAKGGSSLGISGVDFVDNAQTINFATGEISKTFSVPIKNDGTAEAAENFSMQLFEPVTATLGAQQSADVVILDTATSPLLQDATFSVVENRANGSQVPPSGVEQLAASSSVTYSILSGNTNNAFRVDNSGKLFVNNSAALNYEVTPRFVLVIKAEADNGSTDLATWTINLQDQNEAPIFTAQTRSVAENSATNTSVGARLSATDPDGDTISFTLSSAIFGITANGQLFVKDGSKLDYEVQKTYTLNVSITDGKGHTSAAPITVNLLDVVEADPAAPTIVNLSPGLAVAGGKEFVLVVTGQHFTLDTVVRWNGSARKTELAKDGTLRALISAQDIAAATTAKVDVIDGKSKKQSDVFAFAVIRGLVGIADLHATPQGAQGSAVGVVTQFNLEWTHTSQPWRTMDEMDLRLINGDAIALWVRYQEARDEAGLENSTIILLNADGTPAGIGHFGDATVLENETVRLDLANAKLVPSGETGKHVLVSIPVTFKSAAVIDSPYTIEMYGVDDLDGEQGPNVFGSWTVSKPETYLPGLFAQK